MKRLSIVLLFILLLTSFTGCSTGDITNVSPSGNNQNINLSSSADLTTPIVKPSDSNDYIIQEPSEIPAVMPNGDINLLEVHFLDVGQADCILIKTPEQKVILIDSGKNSDEDTVVSYIKSQKIDKIDVAIGTHPHEDHIGGLDAVINSFDIGKVFMPKVSHTTKTFEDVLNAIKNKGLKVTTAFAGTSIELDTTLKIEMLAPNSDGYDKMNDYSAVIKLTYDNTSFLFTGDAENISEKEMISKGYDLKADVLKVGHHGSATSTTAVFLKKVDPEYAIISVGKYNNYGHPDKLILNRLKTHGVEVFRTDEIGTIIAVSDGEAIKFEKNPSNITEQIPPVESKVSSADLATATNSPEKTPENVETIEIIVYITESGDKYHSDGCQYIRKSKIPISLEEAKDKGYTPCKRCKPSY